MLCVISLLVLYMTIQKKPQKFKKIAVENRKKDA